MKIIAHHSEAFSRNNCGYACFDFVKYESPYIFVRKTRGTLNHFQRNQTVILTKCPKRSKCVTFMLQYLEVKILFQLGITKSDIIWYLCLVCSKFYTKVLLFETVTFQNLTDVNVRKLKYLCSSPSNVDHQILLLHHV